jgi:hypothetical protein
MSATASERTLTAEVLRTGLDALEEQTDEAAEAIRASLGARRDAIEADRELSPLGRRRQREEAERGHRERMDALRDEHDERRSALLARARVTAFGATTKGSELATRDARDRAAKLDQDRELARELRRALERRDELYASGGPRSLTGARPPHPQTLKSTPPMTVRALAETPSTGRSSWTSGTVERRETCMNKGIEAMVVTSPAPSWELLSARTAPVARRLTPTLKPTPSERGLTS